MKKIKIFALAFVLTGSFSCHKEALDFDPPTNSELKSVNGQADPWGNNCLRRIDCLTIEQHPPIKDLRRNFTSTTVFKDAIWRLGHSSIGITGSFIISRSTNGIDWKKIAILPNNGVNFWQLVTFKNELWLRGGDHPMLPRGMDRSGPNLLKSSDGYHWESAESSTLTKFIRNLFVFNNRLYAYTQGELFIYREKENSWSGIHYPIGDPYRSMPEDMVVFKNELYVFRSPHFNSHRNIIYPMEVWKSFDAITWRRVFLHFPYMWNRANNSVTNYNGKLWIIGGYDLDTSAVDETNSTNEIWYSDDAISWKKFSRHNPILPIYSTNHSATVFKNKLWLFGGNYLGTSISPTYSISF